MCVGNRQNSQGKGQANQIALNITVYLYHVCHLWHKVKPCQRRRHPANFRWVTVYIDVHWWSLYIYIYIYIDVHWWSLYTHIYIFTLMYIDDNWCNSYRYRIIIEGSLEVKLPTIWTDEKQSRAEAERRERLEERRVEEKESEESGSIP